MRLVKWRHVSQDRRSRVTQRLHALQCRSPLAVPKLLSFGWAPMGMLRLEFEHVDGQTLESMGSALSAAERQNLGKTLSDVANHWRKQGFVHGDLSPRNILVGRKLWVIDWILDLESFEGTPAYASEEVFHGRRGFGSDAYALDLVLNAYRLW